MQVDAGQRLVQLAVLLALLLENAGRVLTRDTLPIVSEKMAKVWAGSLSRPLTLKKPLSIGMVVDGEKWLHRANVPSVPKQYAYVLSAVSAAHVGAKLNSVLVVYGENTP